LPSLTHFAFRGPGFKASDTTADGETVILGCNDATRLCTSESLTTFEVGDARTVPVASAALFQSRTPPITVYVNIVPKGWV